jgi:hypothetical protein
MKRVSGKATEPKVKVMVNSKDATELTEKGPRKKPATDDAKDGKIEIKKGKVDSMTIYEVKEGELDILEKGSANSIFLNMGIALSSFFVSFLIGLLTGDFSQKPKLEMGFLFTTISTGLIAAVLITLWLVKKNEFKETIKTIKDRILGAS